jgi:hypothetical protein
LGYGTTFLNSQLLDLFNDCFVLVEIFSLELGTCLPIKNVSFYYNTIRKYINLRREIHSCDGNRQAQNRPEIRN